jgi:tRNA threonylcarbamoyl adenosine modification protein YeaZ
LRILGIDTTTKFFCVGLYDNGRIYEYNLETGIRLSSLITVTLKRLLDALDWKIKDIDYFACGLGPGSFTGTRVGIATIKGLTLSINRPVIGISTLDILAKNVLYTDNPIVPIIDAKRNLVYCSIFKYKSGLLKRLRPYMLLSEEDFFKNIQPDTIVLGDAVSLYKDRLIKNIKGAQILDSDYWYPKAHSIINLTLERIKNKKIDSPFKIRPIYLYPKECQIANRK